MIALPAYAQEEDPVLRLERMSVVETPLGADTLTGKDLAGLYFLHQGLESLTGLNQNNAGGFGRLSSVRLRGGRASHTLVLIDGVPVGDATAPNGAFDFAHLTLNNIETIQISKGGQSGIWGSQALNGVIHVTSPEAGRQGFKAQIDAHYGSFDSFSGALALEAGNPMIGGRIALTHFGSGGISAAEARNGNDERDAYANTHLAASARLNHPSGLTLKASLRQIWSRTEYDGLLPPDYQQIGDSPDYQRRNELSGHVGLLVPLPEINARLRLLFGHWQIQRMNNSEPHVQSFSTQGQRLLWRQFLEANLTARNTSRFGLDYRNTRVDTHQRNQTSLFWLHEYRPTPRWYLSGGLRFEHSATYGLAAPWHISLAYAPRPNMRVWARWGQGFAAPTLFQAYSFFPPALQSNPDLHAEHSNSYELGLQWASPNQNFNAKLVGFARTVSDLIAYQDGQYVNIAQAEAQGAELSVRFRPKDWLSLRFHYTFTHAQDNGAPALNVSPHRGGTSLEFEARTLSFRLLALFVGPQAQTGGQAPGWIRLDAASKWMIMPKIALYLRVENLLNAQYQDTLGYGTPGLSAYGGIRLSLSP